MHRRFVLAIFGFLTLFSFSSTLLADKPATLSVSSSAFKNGQKIPAKYTCDGKNISPSLRWSQGPRGTQSYAIIMEDPDAPVQTWVHWVVYDMPPTIFYIPKGFPAIKKLANAEKHGMNDFKKFGYGGPCPPSGEHRYFFRVYALDKMFIAEPGLTKGELMRLMEGHILAEGSLMGRYKRPERPLEANS